MVHILLIFYAKIFILYNSSLTESNTTMSHFTRMHQSGACRVLSKLKLKKKNILSLKEPRTCHGLVRKTILCVRTFVLSADN